jgi:hypothetical protein
MTEGREQRTDAGNQIVWIVYFDNLSDPPAPPIKLCLTLCTMFRALFALNP